MLCLSDTIIGMHAGSVKGMDPVLTHGIHLKLHYNTIISGQVFFSCRVHISNNFPASKAYQKPWWLQLKSHSWLAIKLCASMMMIMSGNNGCNACQRGNASDISTSKTTAPAVCNRLRVPG